MKITIEQIGKFFDVLKQPCCYPKGNRKRFSERFFDNLKWYILEGRVNEDYNLYGLDLVGSNQDLYLSHRTRVSDMIELKKKFRYNELLSYLDDKYLFFLFCKQNNLPHPEVFEYYVDGKLNWSSDCDLNKLLDRNNLFCKSTTGYGGYEVKRVDSLSDLNYLKEKWKDKTYIIQEGVKNNKAISSLYNSSLNTIRCVTFSDGDRVSMFSIVLRCGTSISGNVDNVSSGGVVIGIDTDGKLMKYGHYDNYYRTKSTKHPDTGTVFLGFEIPCFNDVVDLAIKAHSCIKEVPSVGWDIAVTDSGVVLIEGNYDWGLQILQMCHGGLKDKWSMYMNLLNN